MSFLKTFLARPLAWLIAVAVGLGGGVIAYIVTALEAAKANAATQLGGVEALIVAAFLGVLAKFIGALGAKYLPKPIVPPVEPEPPPPSASRHF